MRRIITILMCTLSIYASDFFIMTEDLKPFNYFEDGKLKGISKEVVQKVLKNLGYKDEDIVLYPWSRAVNILESNKKAVLFSISYSEERAKKYKLACPLSEVAVYFFVKKDSGLDVSSLDDIRDLKIGVVQDFGAHKYLVEKGFSSFDYSSSTKVMAQKLLDNKIDIFPSTPFAVHSLDINTSALKQTPLKLYSRELCIAFNKAISDKEVKKWEEQLKDIHKSGEYNTIYNKYIKED